MEKIKSDAQENRPSGILWRATAPQRDQRVCLCILSGGNGALRSRNTERDLLAVNLNRHTSLFRRSQAVNCIRTTITGTSCTDIPCMDKSKRNGVRAHAKGTPLFRDGLREPNDSRLRRGVVCLTDVPVQARRRRDVDDRAVLVLFWLQAEVRRCLADEAERRADVDLEDDVERLVRRRVQHLVECEPCVVHYVVNLAEFPGESLFCETNIGELGLCNALHCGIHDFLGEVVCADVTRDREYFAPESLDLALNSLEALGVDATVQI